MRFPAGAVMFAATLRRLWPCAGRTLVAKVHEVDHVLTLARDMASKRGAGATMSGFVPAGFQHIGPLEGFIEGNGPYYWRRDAAGRLEFGFQSDARHLNPHGVLHGGAILGFLDTILGYVVVHETQRRCATITLDTRFMASAPAGQWISGRAEVKRLTRSLAFVDAEATANGTLLVTATAVSRIFDT
jgi:uncharacterized protein (TIGR00369 family)